MGEVGIGGFVDSCGAGLVADLEQVAPECSALWVDEEMGLASGIAEAGVEGVDAVANRRVATEYPLVGESCVVE